MQHLKLKAFVIRVVPVGDTDRIITLLTSQHGLISVSCRGARRTRSPHLLATQIFSFSDFELFQNKGRYSLNSAQLITAFTQLQEDVEKLILASHLAEVVLDCSKEGLAQPAVYQLWAHSIQALATRPDGLLVVHVAQLRLLMEIGFSPRLTECISCGRPLAELDKTRLFFSLSGGGLVCQQSSCHSRQVDKRPLEPGVLASLSYIQKAQLGRLFSFSLDSHLAKQLIRLSADYVNYQLDKSYQRLSMLQNLTEPDLFLTRPAPKEQKED